MIVVAIFRHQLFKISEPFIWQQASRLKRFNPIYLGRARFGTPPEGAVSFAIEDLPEQRALRRKVWQVITRDPGAYQRLLGGRRPALIHAHFGVEGVYALPLAQRLGVPLVTTFHGFDATTTNLGLLRSGKPSWINFALSRHHLSEHGDMFLCVSEFIRDRVLELGFPEERVHVHYIGVDTEVIRPRTAVEEARIVLHVARLVEKKGTEYLIRAFAKVAEQVADITLVIVGEGPLEESLRALARSLGQGKRVRFKGAQPHTAVVAWLRKAAVLVLPSVQAQNGDAEGLGMVLLEAGATGVPVIATDHGGIPEAVIDGQTGYLVPERSVEALAERMGELLADDAKRRRMGEAARALVETRFDIRRQATELEALYDGTLR